MFSFATDDASGVIVNDTLPGNLVSPVIANDGGATCTISSGILNCAIGNLAAGSSVTIEVTGNVSASATTISNTAAIAGAEIDPNPVNDTSTVSADVTPVAGVSADLSLTKVADVSDAAPGVGCE